MNCTGDSVKIRSYPYRETDGGTKVAVLQALSCNELAYKGEVEI
jgi:hypothetical protein